MEYVGGVTLAHSIAARPFQSRDAAGMLQTLATTLHTIHQRGIAHCDLKPSNVLCTELGELKITDFGLARRSADDHDVTIGTLLGTPNYMAPELIGGLSSTGVSCDIYSLGVILYELLTGTPPYHGISILDTLRCVLEQPIPSPRKRRSDIPADLEMICQKCLSRNPQQRYLSAGDLAQDLQRFRDGRSVSARPVGVFRQFGRHMARQPIACLLGALLCLTACYGLIAVTWERHLNRTAVRQVEEERGRSAELGREADRAQHQAELHRRELERRHVRLRSAVEQIDRGRQAMLQMHWDQALHAFSLAHDRVPELATALEERGNLYLTLHLYERAGEDLRAAYALHQPAEHTRWMRDAPLFMLLQDKLGFDAVSATIRRNRFHPADYMRITTLASSNEPDLAAWTHAVLQTSQEANTSPQHAHALARAFLRLGQNSDAILVCDQLLNGDWAERGSVYPTLAVAQYRLRQYEAAEDAMQAAQARYQVWTKQFLQPPDDRWIIHQNVQPHWPVSSDTWFEFLVHYREACDELNWTPQVTASRHLLRARGLAGLRRPAEAIVEYELAREIAPDDPQVLLELHRSRAFQYVTQIRFAAAAKQYAAAAEFSPHDSHLLNFLAYAYLASFRMADYQATCEGMAVQWRDSQDTQDLLKLCDACANHPDAVEDWPALERVARRFEPMLRPVSTRSCARILYRVGKHQEAIELLEQLERTEPLRGTDFCFLALANHALDRSDQSRRRLTQAVTWMVDGNPPEGAWTDRIQTLVMYREAIAKVPRDLSLNTSER
jgi:tetratricopeptide (TPR) repeat protein